MAISLPANSHAPGVTLRARAPSLRVSWALLGLLLVADQMLLPMFHAGPLSYKVSYLFCGLWLAQRLAFGDPDPVRSRDFRLFVSAFAVIVGCALLGEIWLAANHAVADYGQTFRSLLIYFLVISAFGLGQSAWRFKVSWLIPILLSALLLNFSFIFLKTAMPSWLIDVYYTDRQVQPLTEFGINDVNDLLQMARPRGLFLNPNVSAHMVNIMALFVYLGLRHRLLSVPRPTIAMAIVGLPMLLSTVLTSRGEFLVAGALGLLNYRLMFGRSGPRSRIQIILFTAVLPVVAGIGLMRVLDEDSLRNSVERAASVFDAVSKFGASQDEQSLDSVARPLLTLQRMYDRFQFSPVFGSGFSATSGRPFAEGTEFFHNDWFRIIATSGLIGLAAMFWLLRRYCLPLGWSALIPFVLPALVNSFMLVIPSFMFYFFMIGVLREKMRFGRDAGPATGASAGAG